MSGRVKGSGVLGRWIIIIRKKDTGAEGRCHSRVDSTNDATYIRQAWRVSGSIESDALAWHGMAAAGSCVVTGATPGRSGGPNLQPESEQSDSSTIFLEKHARARALSFSTLTA